MAENNKAAKPKRRLRTRSETVRQRSEKPQPVAKKPGKLNGAKRIISKIFSPLRFIGRYIIPPYIKNSWRELRQVTWPNRKQSRQLTLAVIIFAVIFGVLVAGVDYGLDKLFKNILLK